jgi:hypothetical protein
MTVKEREIDRERVGLLDVIFAAAASSYSSSFSFVFR